MSTKQGSTYRHLPYSFVSGANVYCIVGWLKATVPQHCGMPREIFRVTLLPSRMRDCATTVQTLTSAQRPQTSIISMVCRTSNSQYYSATDMQVAPDHHCARYCGVVSGRCRFPQRNSCPLMGQLMRTAICHHSNKSISLIYMSRREATSKEFSR